MADRQLGAGEWTLLAHRLPRVPSVPRSALWRKLKRAGAARLSADLVLRALSVASDEDPVLTTTGRVFDTVYEFLCRGVLRPERTPA